MEQSKQCNTDLGEGLFERAALLRRCLAIPIFFVFVLTNVIPGLGCNSFWIPSIT